MSKTIDERVVSLQFDNKNFEKNAKDTMSTLDKLKEKLSFKGASKGLEEVNDAAKNVNMSGLENNVGKVGLKFNWLHSVAHSALDRITNKVMDTGERLVKSLTIDPVKTGLSEYETQLNSVQTILANTESKGSTLKDVNRALDELNKYADQTIYNFTEMTRNIGTFTAAGVDLDTSVRSIKGIANLAAVSGSTSQQASTAMYQLSQALASGTVKLMDWNSVVNAGMGGEVFQDALKETARVHGVAIDDIIKSQGSFRESLSEGWLTADILNETLEKFTMTTDGLSKAEIEANRVKLRNIGYTEEQIDKIFKLGNTATAAATKVKTASQMIDVMKESAQSGWAQSWEIIIGDFEEAKELWTMASDAFTKVIGDSAEKRNKLLKDTLSSGWDKWMEKGIMDEEGYEFHLKEVIKQNEKITQGLKDAGLADSFAELIEFNGGSLTKALRQGFQAGVIPAETLSESVARLTDAYSKCSDEELEAAGYTRAQYENMVKLNEQFQNGKLSAEDFAAAITKLSGRELIFDKELGILPNIFKSIYEMIKPIGNAWETIFPSDGRAEKIYNILAKIQEKVLGFKDSVIENGDKIFRTFRGLFSVIGMVWHVIKLLYGAVKKVASAFHIVNVDVLGVTASFGDFLYGLYQTLTGSKKLTDTLDSITNALVAVGQGIKNFFTIAKSKIDMSGFTGFAETLKKVWEFIKKIFSSILNVIKNIGNSIADTIDGTGITGVLDLLNAGLIAALIIKIKGLFSNFGGILDNFNEIMEGVSDTLSSFQQAIKAEALKAVAVAIAILAGSILVISLINKEKLETALAAITMLFIELSVLMKVVGKSQYALKGGGSMIAMGVTLFLMAATLKKLAGIGWDKMIPAMGAMGLALLAFIAVLGITSRMDSKSIHALKMIGIISTLAFAMIPLSIAMRIIAKMDWDSVLKGLAMVGAVIVAMVTVMGLMKLLSGSSKGINITNTLNPVVNIANGLGDAIKEIFKVVAQGTSIALLAFAMLEIAAAIALMSAIPWEKMKYGLLGMAAAYVTLMVAIRILNKIDATNSIKNAFALMLLMVPLTTMALTLALLSLLDWEKMILGLIVMDLALDTMTGMLKRISKMNPEGIGKKVISLTALLIPMIGMTSLLMILGNLKFGTIVKGLIAMNGMLTILTKTLKKISKISTSSVSSKTKSKKGMFSFLGSKTELLQNAAALLILASAIGGMTISLMILGNLKWGTIIKGLTAMAGILLVLGVATKFLSTLGGGFMVFSTGALSMGLACLTAAAGIYLLAKGLNLIIKSLGETIRVLCQVIIETGPLIAQAITTIIVSLLRSLVTVIDELVSNLMQIIVNSIRSSAEYIPEMADAFMDLLVGVVDALIEYIPEIVQLVSKVLSKLFGAIMDELAGVDSGIFTRILLGIGAMILIMKQLATLKKDIVNALLGAVGLVAVFTVLIGLFGLIADNVSGGFVEDALTLIKEIGAPDVVLSLGLLGLLMSSLMGIAKKFKLTDKGSFNVIFKMAANLIIFIGALTLLYSVIGLLATIDGFTRNIEAAVDVIKIIGAPHVVGCLALLATLMIAINAAAQYLLLSYNLNDMLKVAKNLVIFIGALIMLFSAIGIFTTIDGFVRNIEEAAEVIKVIGSPAVIGCLTLLSGLMIAIGYVTEKFKVNISFKNIVKIAGAMTVFIGALVLLFSALGLLTKIEGFVDNLTNGAHILGLISASLSVSLLMLAGLAIALSRIKMDGKGLGNIAKNAAGLAIIIGVLAVLCGAIGGLAMIPGVNEALTNGIGILKQLCTPDFIVSLGLLTVLSLALAAFSLVGTAAITGGLMLAGVILELAVIMYALGAIAAIPDVTNTISAGLDVIKMLGSPDTIIAFGLIALFMSAVGLLAPLIGAAVIAMTGLMAVIAVTTAALMALGLMFREPGVKEAIADGGQMLASIGKAIGSFVGGIVDGFAMAATENLPELGKRFSQFMVNMLPFLTVAKQIPDGVAETVGNLAKALLTLTGANLLKQLTDWLFGEQDLSHFGTTLTEFGKGVKAFNDEVKDIEVTTIVKGAEAGKLLAEMASEMPRQDGLWQKIIGSKDLKSFGGTLQKFGEGVRLFGEEVKNVEPDAIKAGAEAGTQLAEMASELSRSGGKWQDVFGEKDLGLFSTQVTAFGGAIYGFGSAVSDIGADTVKAAAEAAIYLVEAVNDFTITDESPIMNVNMETFRTKLTGLYVAIDSFVTSMGKVSATTVEAVKGKMNTLTTAIQSLSKNGVEAMSNTFRNSTTDVTGAVSGMISSAITTVKSFGIRMLFAAKDLVTNFINGFKSSKSAAVTAITDVYNATFSAIDNEVNYDDFYSTGAFLLEGFANGISDSSYLAEQSAASAAKAAKEAIDTALGIESPSKELYKSGEYTIEGYTNALDDGQSDISKAGSSMGNRLLSVFNDYILRIQQMIEDGIEINPVIRPTLDLSYVEGGMARLNGMFSDSGYMARINSTSAQMSKNQNGSSNEDIVDAIGELGDRIENAQGDRINVGNININDSDEDVAEAIEILIRKALLERRR